MTAELELDVERVAKVEANIRARSGGGWSLRYESREDGGRIVCNATGWPLERAQRAIDAHLIDERARELVQHGGLTLGGALLVARAEHEGERDLDDELAQLGGEPESHGTRRTGGK